MQARRAHGSGHRFSSCHRQKLDRLTVKRTANSKTRDIPSTIERLFPKRHLPRVAPI
jgi:hypothetical protein